MIRPDIEKMFDEINQEHFDGVINPIPVLWNTRMTTTAGMCRYRRSFGQYTPFKIELSLKLFRNLDFDISKVRRTLTHEMVHAWLIQEFNETGHGYRFQRKMTDITGEHKNHRCHNYDVSGLKRKQAKKVKAVCNRCGFSYHKARMPKHAEYATYRHRGCGGAITFARETENKVQIF